MQTLSQMFPHKKTYIGIVIFIVIFYSLVYILAWILIERPESLNRDMGVADFEKNKETYIKILKCYTDTEDANWCEKLDISRDTFLSTIKTANICWFSNSGGEVTDYFLIKRWFSYETDNYYAYALDKAEQPLVFKWTIELNREVIDLWGGWCVYLRKK